MTPSLFDLVEYNGNKLTVCGIGASGVLTLIEKSWPVEFGTFDEYVPPQPVIADVGSVSVVEGGRDRLLAVARLLIEADDNAEARQHLEWNDVEAALHAATEVLPSSLLTIGERGWSISEQVPDDMLLLVNPAARIIATHVLGMGDANLSDVEEATSDARRAIAQHGNEVPTPGI